jgi:phospholipid/cholesterol/gamma-HCH transport system permease protein
MFLQVAESIGKRVLALCDVFGFFSLFLCEVLIALVTTRLRSRKLFDQMRFIGVDSINIILLTGAFSGAVLALQSYIGFKRFGAEEFIGPVVALSLTRELGPVLTGLMVTGRAGSAIAAEIGTMQITEQIDALKTLNINVNQYLMIPRILGSVIIMPFLTVFSMMCGIIGGYIISVYVLNLNGEQYISGIKSFLELSDITGGLIKSSVFGLILSWVGCYKGYYTSGGAKGVGIATTQSVVTASILILISNYFLATMLFK